LTGGQQHTDHIENGQRVSQHSLPTLCFLFFSHPHFLKTNKRSDSRAPLIDKLNKRVIFSQPALAHWLLPLPAKPTLQQKPKSQFCPHTNDTLGLRKTIFTDIKINCKTAA
jgi:hypothetical protein